jgi:hypothetical protein
MHVMACLGTYLRYKLRKKHIMVCLGTCLHSLQAHHGVFAFLRNKHIMACLLDTQTKGKRTILETVISYNMPWYKTK